MRIPFVAFIILLIISVLIDVYIYLDVRRNTARRGRAWAYGYGVSALLCLAFLIVVYLLPKRDADSSVVPVMWMLYSYLTVYAAKLAFIILSLFGRLFNRLARSHINFSLYLALPAAFLMFFTFWWGSLVTVREIDETNVTITSPRLPDKFNGYKILQFSDAHVGTWGSDTTFVSQLVDRINRLHPDVILFTGDIVNRQSSELEPFVNLLSRLHAPDGVYSILGNHDYGDYITWENEKIKAEDFGRLMTMQNKMGWKMLNNDHDFIVRGNDSIAIIGIENWGEPPFSQYGKMEEAYPLSEDSVYNYNDGRFKIMLTHNPEHWNREVSQKTNVDLTLSGHTHAMQFMLSAFGRHWSPAQYKYAQWGGLYSVNGKEGNPLFLNVNIGCGEVGMPMRIGAEPELTLITLKKGSQTAGESDF